MVKFSLTENDVLALLSFLAKNPDIYQTQANIGAAIGVDQRRIHKLIKTIEKYGPNGSAIFKTASKYGFDVKFIGERGRIFDVVYRGRVHNY